jgi:hypothetical protein
MAGDNLPDEFPSAVLIASFSFLETVIERNSRRCCRCSHVALLLGGAGYANN